MWKAYVSTVSREKLQILQIFNEITYFRKKKYPILKKCHPRKNFIFRHLDMNLANLLRNTDLFMHNKIAHLKKISAVRKVYILTISCEFF